MRWRMQHCQNHHFETICSGNGNLARALLHTSWKLKYKFPRWLVKLWIVQVSTSSSVTWRDICQKSSNSDRRASLIDSIFVVGLWVWQTCRAVTVCDILSKGGPKTCLMLAWQPIYKVRCSRIMRLWIRCFGNNPEHSGGKQVENWVRTNEMLKICQKVVPW